MRDISVVIPCYNAERYIGATLRSVHAQGDAVGEVVVVDDGSRDGSADLVRREFPDAKLVVQPNAGVAAARNRGIAAASHEWIAFVDADDIWLPGKLALQREALSGQADARMCYTAWHVWPSQQPEPEPGLLAELLEQAGDSTRWAGPSGWIYPELLLDCEVWTSTVLVHRSVLDEVGGFDADLRIGEDYDLWLRASRVTPIVRVCRPLALYRMHPANTTTRLPARNHKGEVIARALQRWGYAAPDGRTARSSDVERGLARSWADFGGAHLIGGDLRVARRAAWCALRHDPSHGLGWKVLVKALARSIAA